MQIFKKKKRIYLLLAGNNINTAEVFALHMDLQALQLIKQAETFNNSLENSICVLGSIPPFL